MAQRNWLGLAPISGGDDDRAIERGKLSEDSVAAGDRLVPFGAVPPPPPTDPLVVMAQSLWTECQQLAQTSDIAEHNWKYAVAMAAPPRPIPWASAPWPGSALIRPRQPWRWLREISPAHR